MSEGYTVIHQPHRCPKPTQDYPVGTVIRCKECSREWVMSWFNWVPVKKREG